MSLPLPIPWIPQYFTDIISSIGLSGSGQDTAPAVFVLLTIATWPVSILLRQLRNRFLRQYITAIVGLTIASMTFGIPTVCVFLVFVFSFYVPCRYRIINPGWITFLVLATLGWIHYDSMLTGTAKDRFSFTGTLMMMAAKLSMFAFHVHDGHLLSAGKPLSSYPHIAENRKRTAITSPVSLLDFFCYMFEYMGGIVGPLFTYSEYMDFVLQKGDFQSIRSVSVLYPSIKSIGRAFAVLGIYLFLQNTPWTNINTLISEEFLSQPLYIRLVLSPLVIAACRSAYFAIWCLSEVACTLSGLAYHPPNRFNRGTNVNIIHFEFSRNFNQVTNNWNIRISELWLKNCIYQRIETVPFLLRPVFGGKKGLANFTTKVTSALWHGWYPGYLISFISLGLGNWSETVLRKHVHPWIPSRILHSRISTVVAWMHTWWSVNLFFAPFLYLEWNESRIYYESIFWSIHLYHIAIISASLLVPLRCISKTDKVD
jgi:lysophospholipid acyltransferase